MLCMRTNHDNPEQDGIENRKQEEWSAVQRRVRLFLKTKGPRNKGTVSHAMT